MVPTNIKNKSVGYKGGIQCTTQKRKLWVKQVLTLDFEKQMLNALIMLIHINKIVLPQTGSKASLIGGNSKESC